jgi:hypothetical protein
MTKLVLNNQATNAFEIRSYSRNTSFEDGSMNSYIYINMSGSVDLSPLNEIGMNGVTSIALLNDNNETFYNLNNINGRITSIDETLEDNSIFVNMNIRIVGANNSTDEEE